MKPEQELPDDIKRVNERIADLVKKRVEAQQESDAAHERAKQIGDDISRLYITNAKTLAVPYIGHSYYDKRDGSFIIVKKWDEDQGSLIATEFLPPEAAASRHFMIHDRIMGVSDVLNGWYVEIDRDQFWHRWDEFYENYMDFDTLKGLT